jgi:GTP-binding protein EngB required for normal cell division
MDPSEIKKKIGRFRILVIGRANAGKTTVLQKVCNTQGNPEIYNSAGKKVGITMLVRGWQSDDRAMDVRSMPQF